MDPRNRRNYVPYYVTDIVKRKAIYDPDGEIVNGAEAHVQPVEIPKHLRRIGGGKWNLPNMAADFEGRVTVSQAIG